MQRPKIKQPISFKNILEIATKELKGFFDGLYGYLLLIIFLGVTYFLFLQSFFVIGSASTRQLFDLLPIFLIIFIPAVTMATFARENDKQTIEYLVTKPVSIIELVLGKLLSSFTFGSLALLLTLPLPFLIRTIGKIDLGETGASYLAGLLLIMALSAVGIMVSSFFKNQIGAFLVSVTVVFLLYIISSQSAVSNLPEPISNFIYQLGLNNYFNSMIRGVLKLGDILYFGLLTFIAVSITYVNLQKQRISNKKELYKKAVLIISAVTLLSFGVIYLSQTFKFRIDLTESRKYTLSSATKEVLNKDGKVKIDVYASEGMPQEFKTAFDEVKNILEDYKLEGQDKLEISYLNPKDNEASLRQLGITPIQFSIVGDDQYSTKEGYLGLVMKNEAGDKTQVIPFVRNAEDINNLEYQITRMINKIKQSEPTKLAFASGNGEYGEFEDYGLFAQLLGDNFDVQSTYIPAEDIETEDTKKPEESGTFTLEGTNTLLIANPAVKYTDDALKKIKDFLNNGGKVIYAVDGQNVAPTGQTQPFATDEAPQGDLFADLGAKITTDTLYDLQSYQTVGVTTETGAQIPVPYPLFPRLMRKDASISTMPQVLQTVWPNTLNIEDQNNWKILYESTSRAGVLTGFLNTDPSQNFSPENLKSYPVIAYRDFDNGGKLVMVANARMLTNDYIRNDESLAVFALSLSESFGNNIKLSEIRAKNLFTSNFTKLEENDKNLIRFGAPVISVALLGLLGASRIYRKKRLAKYINTL